MKITLFFLHAQALSVDRVRPANAGIHARLPDLALRFRQVQIVVFSKLPEHIIAYGVAPAPLAEVLRRGGWIPRGYRSALHLLKDHDVDYERDRAQGEHCMQ